MRARFLLFSALSGLIIFTTNNLYGQSEAIFKFGSDFRLPILSAPTGDGGLIVCARRAREEQFVSNWDIDIAKLDSNNKIVWAKHLKRKEMSANGVPLFPRMLSINLLPDESFMLTGYGVLDSLSTTLLVNVRFDKDGNFLTGSAFFLEGFNFDPVTSKLKDTTLYIYGYLRDSNSKTSGHFIALINFQGDLVRFRSYVGQSLDLIRDLQIDGFGNIYTCGGEQSSGGYVPFIDLFSADDDINSHQVLTGSDLNYAHTLNIIGDGILLSGAADNFQRTFLTLLPRKQSADSGTALIVDSRSQGKHIITSDSEVYLYLSQVLAKVDLNGDSVIWAKQFLNSFSSGEDFFYNTTTEKIKVISPYNGDVFGSFESIDILTTNTAGEGCNTIDLQLPSYTSGYAITDTTRQKLNLQPTAVDVKMNACDLKTASIEFICHTRKPVAGFTLTDPVICAGDSINIQNNSFYSMKWSWESSGAGIFVFDGETPPAIRFNDTGIHTIRLIVSNTTGSDTFERTVQVFGCGLSFYFPSAFSPNHDTLNDKFTVIGEYIEHFSLQVINRWGEKVFSTNDHNAGWDGTFKGRDCPEGAYFYSYVISGTKGESRHGKGVIHLFK